MEIELKFSISQEELTKFLQSEFFCKQHLEGSCEVLQLESIYYDTCDRRFRKEGTAYRVRSTRFSNGKVAYESTTKRTLKKVNGLSSREEINEAQSDDSPKYADVKELFRTVVTRKIYLLKYGAAVVEMAIDRGLLKAINGRSEIIEEVEFELKQGTEQDLENLRLELGKIAEFEEKPQSKYARGLALLGEA